MLMTPEELDAIVFRCGELSSIEYVYEEIRIRHPMLNDIELKDLFLWCIRELMQQGRLKFVGEGQISEGINLEALPYRSDFPLETFKELLRKNGIHPPLQFGDKRFGTSGILKKGQLPEGISVGVLPYMPDFPLEAFNELLRESGILSKTPLKFGDKPFGPDDVLINDLRQPDNPSPEILAQREQRRWLPPIPSVDPDPDIVVRLIDSKWPVELRPTWNVKEPGFDPVWFLKWGFLWFDKEGKLIKF